MYLSFWPDRAWQYLMAPAWPWALSTDATFGPRVQEALVPYWSARLGTVPETLLGTSLREKIALAQATVTTDSVGAAGFETVAAAAEGRPEAFWFFELGATAWMMSLQRLRREGWLPDTTDYALLAEVESLWGGPDGPAQAMARLTHSIAAIDATPGAPAPVALLLYAVPLAIWHERDHKRGVALLDRALRALSPAAATAMGGTIPLTYALSSALDGQSGRSVEILAEGRVRGRPRHWTGYATPEVRYQRARYAWDAGFQPMALEILTKVLVAAPTYALRLASDPVWFEPGTRALPVPVQGVISALAAQSRNSLGRFVQTRTQGDESIVEVRRIASALSFGGDDTYGLMAAAAELPTLEAWRETQRTVGPSFSSDVERVTAFVREVPETLPLRVGSGYGRRLQGGTDADIDRLVGFLDRGRFTQAEILVEGLLSDLPGATRLGVFGYLQRLVTALATAGDVLRDRGREEDEARYTKIVELLGLCMELVEPIKQFPDDVSPTLSQQLNAVWDRVLGIESAWVQSEARAFGEMRLVLGDAEPVLQRGGFRAVTLTVIDSAGTAVPGVPVIWRVSSGPATPKDPIPCLDGEWGLSLQTGIVYLPLESRGPGDGGVIEAWILGHYSPLVIPYRVIDR